MLRMSPKEQQILFRVGVADVVPKSIVYRLIAPTMALEAPIRITCREDNWIVCSRTWRFSGWIW